jgi:CelD/BcsL family acetyltransferase involved in cellulose biosynthesis
MAERPALLRNTITRKRRKLEREHDCDIKMYRGGEVRDALPDYHAAYSASWKAYEQYGALLDALAVNLSVPDWTRLAVLYIDGEPAAAQLWFVVHGKASIFRLAYDERWKQYSTGSILTAWLMQYVIDTDMVDEIDFLTGNESYKQDWMSERRQRISMTFLCSEDIKPEKKSNWLKSSLMKLAGHLLNK